MIFSIIVVDARGEEWEESYDRNTADPQKEAEGIIAFFNSTLRPGERPRTLVKVVLKDAENTNHTWEKMTSGMSVEFRKQIVDIMRCSVCGITGKRYGMITRVKIDSKFSKKAFQRCDTAVKEFRKVK